MHTTAPQPYGLLCELLARPELTHITSPRPRFGWALPPVDGLQQTAWQILVASNLDLLDADDGDMWDSGAPEIAGRWTTDNRSIDIEYEGAPLQSNTDYWWKVRVWVGVNEVSPWSAAQRFRTGEISSDHATPGYPLQTYTESPETVAVNASGALFVDFGKAAFGTIGIIPGEKSELTVRLGEKTDAPYSIDRNPGGSVRYGEYKLPDQNGGYDLAIPSDERNTGVAAVLMPEDVGEVFPFRYAEIEGPSPRAIHRKTVTYPFDDNAASFVSSNRVLNDVWELCKHSIKATTFCGLYVDGDRERIPYEADAYINQLCHYGCDREYSLARRTHEYLLEFPTWPTEWALHLVLIAWADYQYTGDARSLAAHYDLLKTKSLYELVDDGGLISTTGGRVTEDLLESLNMRHSRYIFKNALEDLVDWPQGERDGYEMVAVNTVVNAFFFRAAVLMARIAAALGKAEDQAFFGKIADRAKNEINSRLFDRKSGIYVDGEGSTHSSIHANMMPLAFGLVPDERLPGVVDFVISRGMACSVYASQYLMEGLYRAGADSHGLALMTSTAERSWAHMIYDVGSTISLEAWDGRFKPNQDWNHAWGAVPANIIPRWLMGIRPAEPGFGKMLIQPKPGGLSFASIKTPTIRGPMEVSFENGETFSMEIVLPGNTEARVILPAGDNARNTRVSVDGVEVFGTPLRRGIQIDGIGPGRHTIKRG